MAILPALLAIDVEPDLRVLDGAEPPAGFEQLLSFVPALRDRLASATGSAARITWSLRMDPQIARVYGTPDWFATRYGDELEQLRAEGDSLGLHPHCWRWRDGWVSDHADESWVAHCAHVALETYRTAFGRACEVYRHGERFMSTALARQIDEAGVRVDLTLEPGLAAVRGLVSGETTAGWLPDTRTAPHFAYRPSLDDFQVPDASRDDGLLMVPLTPGLVVSARATDGRLVPTGSYETLTLWTAPEEFARRLRGRLRQPDLTHLAFAIRTDVGLRPDEWATIERNLAEVGRQLGDGGRWCTAVEAAELIGSRPAPSNRTGEASGTLGDRAALWLRGEADPGYRQAAEPEAVDVLTRAAGDLVHRLGSLGVGNGAETGAPPPVTVSEGGDAGATLRWIDEERELTCPVCGSVGTANRFASVTAASNGRAETGVLRCRHCRAIVLEDAPGAADLGDAAIDEYVEHAAGLAAILAMLSVVEPRPGLRLLDVGCGYGFGLDLARFAWGWDGVGVDPFDIGERGRRELGVDIRPRPLAPDLDLGKQLFDVVLASEVIEHVEDPLALLREVRCRLARDGVLVLSTPDAEFVCPDNPAGDVLTSLAAGGHVFLLDRGGLERLLRRAGFEAVAVHAEGETLRAVASPNEAGVARCRRVAPPDLDLLARYCGTRAEGAPAASALRVGMASRHLQYALHGGDLDGAEAGYGRLRD
ncbi:MAG TPA: class I SAM-dependent methyltransferase, partial [Acidimicrobiia bacterium]|nr:class I SAM-dependent methyltransferase [Acidimicrobiia bacterium]